MAVMTSNSDISHEGRIVEITPEYTRVMIVSKAACASCHAKGLCGLGEIKDKYVEVPTRGWDNYKVGDDVVVTLKASMGHKAVWLAYVAPLAIMMAVILVLVQTGHSELTAGLCSIAGIAVWYFIIWLLRDKLRNEYNFNIKPY